MKPAGYVYMPACINRCEWKDTQSYKPAEKNGIIERIIIRQLLLQTQVTNITATSLSHTSVIFREGGGGLEAGGREKQIFHILLGKLNTVR
jgi:hypothetical protein